MQFPTELQTMSVEEAEHAAREMPRFLEVHDSSVIEYIGYHPNHRIMIVGFPKSVWVYDQVWPSDFAALACAYSVGAVFNERIRNRKDAMRLTPEAKFLQAKRHGTLW